MNKTQLLVKLKQLSDLSNNTTGDTNPILIEMESLIDAYLQKYPQDIDMYITLALVVSTVPLADDIKAIASLEQALAYDPSNSTATLILAYIDMYTGSYNENVLSRLHSISSEDKEIMSMIAYARSWHYEYLRDENAYEKALLESIGLCNQYVWNYDSLGRFYLARSKTYQGIMAIQNAVRNVKHIHIGNESFAIYDSDKFLDSNLKGIYITIPQLEMIYETLSSTAERS